VSGTLDWHPGHLPTGGLKGIAQSLPAAEGNHTILGPVSHQERWGVGANLAQRAGCRESRRIRVRPEESPANAVAVITVLRLVAQVRWAGTHRDRLPRLVRRAGMSLPAQWPRSYLTASPS